MNLQVDVERVCLAYKTVRSELMAERTPGGHWVGQLASSPLATATAISALVVAHRRDADDALRDDSTGTGATAVEHLVQGELSELLVESLHWLARYQNQDGGWGDCDRARSNIAATMLVQAAFRLTGVPARYADLIARADQYVAAQGGVAGLRRHCGRDKTLVAPILANCALAGMVPWRQVPTLRFELACLPQRWQQHFQSPVVRHATARLVAIGRAKFHHAPPRNPIMWLLRRSLWTKSLAVLEGLQAADDGFLASAPLTAFVVMSLTSTGCLEHPIVERGVEFLLSSVRADASWPVENNLATWNTTLALNSLASEQPAAAAGPTRPPATSSIAGRFLRDPSAVRGTAWHDTSHNGDAFADTAAVDNTRQPNGGATRETPVDDEIPFNARCLEWLLDCQLTQPHAMTGVSPGGWGRSDLPSASLNTDDTAGALLALAHWQRCAPQQQRDRVERAARLGIVWLLDLQDDGGGWPTFYRDSRARPFDEVGSDVTAHALRALAAWQRHWQLEAPTNSWLSDWPGLNERITAAVDRGLEYLATDQREDGSFIPLWFGNEHQPEERNPVCGTARVLVMCAELDRLDTEMAHRAVRWLLSAQHAGGGWGPPRAPLDYSGVYKDGFRAWRANDTLAKFCSVEETALAVTALLPLAETNQACSQAVSNGLNWLVNAVEQDAHRQGAILGFYFSRLWYHERLYPLVFAAGALSRAVWQVAPQRSAVVPVG